MNILTTSDNVNMWEVRNLLDHLIRVAENRSRAWHDMMDKYDDDFYLRETGDISPVRDEQKVYLTDLADTVTLAKNLLLNAGYKVKVDRPGDMRPDKLQAGAIESYLRSVLTSVEQRRGENVLNRVIGDQMRLGMGVIHWAYAPPPQVGLQADLVPYQQSNVDVWAVDPRATNPVFGGPFGNLQYVVHAEKRNIFSIHEMLENGFGDEAAWEQMRTYYGTFTGADVYDHFETLYNYWGWHSIGGKWIVVNAVKYGEAILRPFMPLPTYQLLPWAMIPAQDTGAEDYADRFLPITYHARVHVRRAERIQGQMDIIGQKIADMPYTLELSPEYPEPPDIQAGKDFLVYLKPGQKWNSPEYVNLPRDMWPTLEMTQERIERSSFPRAMYGIGRGPESTISFSSMQEGARLRLVEPCTHLSFGLGLCFNGIRSLVSVHQPEEPVYVAVKTRRQKQQHIILKGKDLLGWIVGAEWRRNLPGDEQRNVASAVQMTGSKLLSTETARERYLEIEDSAREDELILQEKLLLNDPEIAKAYAFQLLQEMDALPNLAAEQQVKVLILLEQKRGEMEAAGASPQEIEQQLKGFLLGIKMGLADKGKTLGDGPGADPPRPQMPPGQPPMQERLPPRPGPEMGGMRQGTAPPGSLTDPGGALRELANLTNGSTGHRQ